MNRDFTKRQRLSLFFTNIIAFAVIFLFLGLIIFHLLNQSAYQETDSTLEDPRITKRMIETEVKRYQKNPDSFPTKNHSEEKESFQSPLTNDFNTQVILWSKEGTILNKAAFGGRISQMSSLRLQKKDLDTIKEVKVNDDAEQLVFHSVTQKYSDDEEIAYVQIVSNVNQIEHSLATFQKIVIVCMITFWLLSIAVSFFLANRSMKPILVSWKKQQEFVENASHELRTPLAIIQNSLEKLFQKPDHTILAESESIAQALNETRRMTALTTDLLMIARSDSNQLVLEKKMTATNDFLQEITKPFAEMAEIQNKTFSVSLDKNRELSFDQKKIHQVFVILLDNALKYTQTGECIKVKSEFSHHYWLVHFQNTGKSISAKDKKFVFDRFYRQDKARSRQTAGYGLGLSIAKEIVDSHHGEVFVQDLIPRGVDFVVKLPLS